MHDRYEVDHEVKRELEFNPDFYDPEVLAISALVRHSLGKEVTEFPVEEHIPR
jgi:hypothetical protein